MLKKSERNDNRLRRKRRIRKKIYGTADRPRLTIYRSNRHIYAQLINDDTGATLVSASTIDEGEVSGDDKTQKAKSVGALLGERAKQANISRVVFDRNGYIYHGRVAAVAEGAREAGLEL